MLYLDLGEYFSDAPLELGRVLEKHRNSDAHLKCKPVQRTVFFCVGGNSVAG